MVLQYRGSIIITILFRSRAFVQVFMNMMNFRRQAGRFDTHSGG